MDVRELRIGNWAQDKDGVRFQVDKLEEGDFINEKWHEDVQPIPFTEEIFQKCGFVPYHNNPRLQWFFVNSQCYYPFLLQMSRDGRYYFNENLEVKDLHQLQNLFHSMTGEELVVDFNLASGADDDQGNR